MALSKLYLAALVIFAVIFIFQVVALSGVYQGWYVRLLPDYLYVRMLSKLVF